MHWRHVQALTSLLLTALQIAVFTYWVRRKQDGSYSAWLETPLEVPLKDDQPLFSIFLFWTINFCLEEYQIICLMFNQLFLVCSEFIVSRVFFNWLFLCFGLFCRLMHWRIRENSFCREQLGFKNASVVIKPAVFSVNFRMELQHYNHVLPVSKLVAILAKLSTNCCIMNIFLHWNADFSNDIIQYKYD